MDRNPPKSYYNITHNILCLIFELTEILHQQASYLGWILKGVNGNGTSNNQYFFFVDIRNNLLSLVPDLYDKEHEWRFEHKLLYDNPDGYVEAEIYCDDVLIHTEKFNYANTGAEQRLIGFNFDGGNANAPFSLRFGDIGTKLTSISIDEKP